MRGGRPGGGRGLRQAVPLRTPRGSEPQGGRPGQYGTHLPKEGGAGLRWCFGARELGRPLLAAGASSCSGVGEEALQPGGIAFLVGGRWVWPAGPMRAGRGLCAAAPAPPRPRPRRASCRLHAVRRPGPGGRGAGPALPLPRAGCPGIAPSSLSPPGRVAVAPEPGLRPSRSFSRPRPLIPSLIQFGSSMLDVGMDVSPPEPPWDPLPLFPGKRSFVIPHPSRIPYLPRFPETPQAPVSSHLTP